ncbi:MAG TPA: cupin [Chloroflexota bacterium]|jgi:quercetin dioxygenase-like cupin family protein
MIPDVRVTRWSDDRPPPDERAARALLSSENLAPYAWGNPPNDSYAVHRHPYHKVLVCLSGSIVFDLPELGRSVELSPGDRLDLPPDLLHSALVGPDGVVCLEAHRTRG